MVILLLHHCWWWWWFYCWWWWWWCQRVVWPPSATCAQQSVGGWLPWGERLPTPAGISFKNIRNLLLLPESCVYIVILYSWIRFRLADCLSVCWWYGGATISQSCQLQNTHCGSKVHKLVDLDQSSSNNVNSEKWTFIDVWHALWSASVPRLQYYEGRSSSPRRTRATDYRLVLSECWIAATSENFKAPFLWASVLSDLMVWSKIRLL